MWKIYIYIVYVLIPLLTYFTSAEDQNIYNNHTATKLKYIYTLDDHCMGQVCRNFHYENASEVAFFELKMEVHISDDATYDLTSAQKTYESMTFENSTFTHFPLHLFFTIDIKELDMRNSGITFVTWENFLMANNLNVLLLSSNKLVSITEMTFIHAAELQYLFLNDNELRYLVNESFRGLQKLKLLDLSNNRLRNLPIDMFTYLPSLQELHLHENRLFSIANDMFLKNEHLFMITLNDNRLYELRDYAFKSQTRLLLLDISNNHPLNILVLNIQVSQLNAANCSLSRVNIYGAVKNVNLRDNKISELYFSQPETLETLNLRNNALQQLASLSRATSLKSLTVADNPDLDNLPEPWLSTELENLNLSNISLKILPTLSLAKQKNLQILNVSSNMLREINPKNFIYLQNLKHLYIHNNDWNCYNLQLIMEILIKPHGISYSHDTYDSNFPGEYIHGIACMYRLEQESENVLKTDYENMLDVEKELEPGMSKMKMKLLDKENNVALAEIEKVRKELQSIVGFYEAKFKKAFDMIDDLRGQLANFQQMNTSFWQHVTITV